MPRLGWLSRLLLLVLILLPMAGTAEAKKAADVGFLKTKVSTTFGNQGILTAVANCPPDMRAVGGGFYFSPGFDLTRGIVYESRKLGQRSWVASTQISDTAMPSTGGLSQVTFAFCRRGAPKTKEVSATIATPDANAAGLGTTAVCPAGRRALAGGFAAPPPVLPNAVPKTIITDSLRIGARGWMTGALKEATGAGPSSLTSYAYCVKRDSAIATGVATAAPAGANELASGVAKCPKNQLVNAGGFSQSGVSPPPSTGALTMTTSSPTDAKHWGIVGLRRGTSTTPTTLRALVYCG